MMNLKRSITECWQNYVMIDFAGNKTYPADTVITYCKNKEYPALISLGTRLNILYNNNSKRSKGFIIKYSVIPDSNL